MEKHSTKKISSVSLLVDGFNFNQAERLIDLLIKNGIRRERIKTLVFAKEEYTINSDHIVFFLPKDIGLFGKIKKREVKFFMEEKSDLLVSYYKGKQKNLEYITLNSKAGFKAGFPSDKNLPNDITIDVSILDYQLFIKELFKYLKSFNKL